MSRLSLLGIVLATSFLYACTEEPTPHPYQEQLEDAVQYYLDVVYEAELRMDSTHLEEVATGVVLDTHLNNIEHYQDNPDWISIDETRLTYVDILDYKLDKASVRVRYDYRSFLRDFETGEREHVPLHRWRWRIVECTLINKDGSWKVDSVEFIDWSG